MKKIIIVSLLIIALLVIAGGIFWWQSQLKVRDLNKSLPSGVKVVKSLFGNDYTVVNKIDGYEFKVPKAWEGLSVIEYVSERIEKGYTASNISGEGNKGYSRVFTIAQFKNSRVDDDLESWAKDNFQIFGLIGDFSKDKIGQFDVVKTREEEHLVGMSVQFFRKNSVIYAITNGSEEFIKEIILNGEW